MARIALVRLKDRESLQWHMDTRLKSISAPLLGSSLVKYEAMQGQAIIPLRVLPLWAAVIKRYNAQNHKKHFVQIHDGFAHELSLWSYDWVVLAMDAQNASDSIELARRLVESKIAVVILTNAAEIYSESEFVPESVIWADFSTAACLAWLKDLDANTLKAHYLKLHIDHESEALCPDWTANNCQDYAPLVLPISIAKRKSKNEITPKKVEDILKEIDELASSGVLTPEKCILFDNPWIESRHIFMLAQALVTRNLQWAATLPRDFDKRDIALLARSGCILAICGQTLSFLAMMRDGSSFMLAKSKLRAIKKSGILCVASFRIAKEGDSIESFDQIAQNIAEVDLPILRLYTPFPETPEYHELEKAGRITTYNWNKFNGKHLVYRPKTLNKELILNKFEVLLKNAYSWPNLIRRNLSSSLLPPRHSLLGTRSTLALKLALSSSARPMRENSASQSDLAMRSCLNYIVLMGKYPNY